MKAWFLVLASWLTNSVWSLPVYGWLLLVSAFAPRIPLLFAVLPPIVIAVAGMEGAIFSVLGGLVEAVLIGGDFNRVTDFISTETYLQHNSQIADGLEGLSTAFAALADQGIAVTYSDLHFVVAEGNFVFTAGKTGFDTGAASQE